MPSAPALSSLCASVASLVLVVLGVTDPNLSAAVQGVAIAAGGLVVSVSVYAHHATRQNADALSVAAAAVAAQAAQAAAAARGHAQAPQTPAATLTPPSGLLALASASKLAALGAAIEQATAGVVASATLPGPAVVGSVPAPSPAGDDAGPFLHAPAHAAPDDATTEVLPALPAVPA